MVSFKIAAAFGTIALAAITGCGSSYSATLSGITPMPDDSVLGQTGGHLNTGIATAFTPLVSMHDTWGTHSETDGIVVSSSDPSVLQAAAVLNSTQGYASSGSSSGASGGSGGNRWVVWGVAPGTATMTVWQGGNVALNVPVQVTDPK